jgi:ribokinase
MGSFVADLAFRTPRLPGWGETVMGTAFRLGPGGKGSNQAVAAARLNGEVVFISKLGRDVFGEMARRTYAEEGIESGFVFETTEQETGAAAIVVDQTKGENAIVVVPGACFHLTPDEVERAIPVIKQAAVFLTQLELPVLVVEGGLKLARKLEVTTILNPAPALALPDSVYPLCDYLTPNETEAAGLTGRTVVTVADAEPAADALLARGVRNVVITLGAQGALVKNSHMMEHIPAFDAGPVIETTGAGDAFNGGLAVGLAEGMNIVDAVRFGCAVASISVTRLGTAPSMPRRSEVEALLQRG